MRLAWFSRRVLSDELAHPFAQLMQRSSCLPSRMGCNSREWCDERLVQAPRGGGADRFDFFDCLHRSLSGDLALSGSLDSFLVFSSEEEWLF